MKHYVKGSCLIETDPNDSLVEKKVIFSTFCPFKKLKKALI